MSGFTVSLGTSPIQTAYPAFGVINLNANLTLSWPSQFQDTNLVVYNITKVIPNNNNHTLTLPDATLATPGQTIIIVNISAHSFTLNKGDATFLATIASNTSVFIALEDNSTIGGTWIINPFGDGFPSVTSVGAVSLSNGITITGSPITDAGILTFDLGNNLAGVNAINTTGISVRVASNNWITRSIVGDANITVTNGNGIAANPQITLNDDITLESIKAGDLELATNIISTTGGNADIVLTPNGTGKVSSTSPLAITTGQPVLFYNSFDTFFVGLKAGAVAANKVWTLPLIDGSDNSLIQTDGAGNLSFTSVTAAGIPKCGIAFDGTSPSPHTIYTSFGIATVTTGGVGIYNVTYSVAFPTSTRIIAGICNTTDSTNAQKAGKINVQSQTANGCTIATVSSENPEVFTAYSYVSLLIY